MRFITILSTLFLITLATQKSFAQDSISLADTIKVKEIKPKSSKVYDPDKAALLSAAFPGLGHIYLKQYWKLPIIWGGGVAVYLLYRTNNENYKLVKGYQFRQSNPTIVIKTDKRLDRLTNGNAANNLDNAERNMRRYRDLTIIIGCISYGLVITDSYVSAHLKGFTISKDLSLKVKPSAQPTVFSGISTGIALNLTIR